MSDTVLIDGQEVSIEDLMRVDLSEVKELRSLVAPAGKYLWRIKECGMRTAEIPVDWNDPQGDKKVVAEYYLSLEAENVFALVDDGLEPEDYIGQTFEKTFLIQKAKDFGFVKAFYVDIGFDGDQEIDELTQQAHGERFISLVTNKPNRKNPDFIVAKLKDCAPYVEEASSEEEDATEDGEQS